MSNPWETPQAIGNSGTDWAITTSVPAELAAQAYERILAGLRARFELKCEAKRLCLAQIGQGRVDWRFDHPYAGHHLGQSGAI